MQIMLMILSCIRGLESFEEGAKAPSAQTLRDRLHLDGDWLDYFHKTMWNIAKTMICRFRRYKWWISIDETHIPFFGNRKKLNKELVTKGLGTLVHGYRAKTPGATGSFCFLMISLCCWHIRIPIAIKIISIKEQRKPWLKPLLKRLITLIPQATILADRGFGSATWFYQMLEELNAKYVVRIPLRKDENKRKVKNGATKFQYWMKNKETKEKVLLTVRVVKDKQNRLYLLSTNLEDMTNKEVLTTYLHRWDIENIFKDSDRVLLPTSSRNPLMRLWCVVTSFFLFTLWQVNKLFTPVTSLRTFLKQIINLLCQLLKCVINALGMLVDRPP